MTIPPRSERFSARGDTVDRILDLMSDYRDKYNVDSKPLNELLTSRIPTKENVSKVYSEHRALAERNKVHFPICNWAQELMVHLHRGWSPRVETVSPVEKTPESIQDSLF